MDEEETGPAAVPRDEAEEHGCLNYSSVDAAEGECDTAGARPASASCEPVHEVPIDQIRPSPENDRLYRPVDEDDGDIRALAESIAQYGVREPLVVSADGWILSGHRRHAAAKLAGLTHVPCRREAIRRLDDLDGFVHLLREYNRQRVKSFDELVREEVVSLNPDDTYAELLKHRQEKSDMSDFCGLAAVEAGVRRARKQISDAKRPFLDAALRVIEDRRDFWPLSDRQVHYGLLNDPPLRHAAKPGSRYRNDRASYQDLTNLLTRARLAGRVPWDAIADETRPITRWLTDRNVHEFFRRELPSLLTGYWRDYQQSQPNHIEILGEKLTVASILRPVAEEYAIPLTIGRGYCSLQPRREIAERFRKSGRQRLILLLVTDFDPDGENIAQSFVRSLRDDFALLGVDAVKVALTAEQVRELELPPVMKAKAGSSQFKKFTGQHGHDVFELEALPPEELQRLLRQAIEQVMDRRAFEREKGQERLESRQIQATREQVLAALAAAHPELE